MEHDMGRETLVVGWSASKVTSDRVLFSPQTHNSCRWRCMYAATTTKRGIPLVGTMLSLEVFFSAIDRVKYEGLANKTVLHFDII